MPQVSPKIIVATVVPAMGVGLGLTFYLMKGKQRIVSLTADKTETTVCGPAVNFTGNVTDGFGRPVVNESVTIYVDNQNAGTLQTDASGNFSFSIMWHTNNQHIDAGGSATVNILACVGKYCSSPVAIALSWTYCTQCPAPS
jgi:hypothetical protein